MIEYICIIMLESASIQLYVNVMLPLWTTFKKVFNAVADALERWTAKVGVQVLYHYLYAGNTRA